MPKLHIRLMPLGIMVGCLIIIGTLFYSLFEGWSYFDSLYFTVMTLTTVGYGDMVPTTPESKLFTIFFVLGGVYLVFHFFRVFTTYYYDKKAPNVKKLVTESLEHMVHWKRDKPEVVLKVKPPDKGQNI